MFDHIYNPGLSASELNTLRAEYAREDNNYLLYLLKNGFKRDCK